MKRNGSREELQTPDEFRRSFGSDRRPSEKLIDTPKELPKLKSEK